jgi:hypothetical protein
VKENDIKKIEELIGTMKCPHNFQCYASGFKQLCRAKIVGIENFLECLEENPVECKFAVQINQYTYLCQCPLRNYIAKKLKH